MATAKLDSIQAGYEKMQPTCRAGTGIHQGVHACSEVSCDSRPSVERPLRYKRGLCSPFIRPPEAVSRRR